MSSGNGYGAALDGQRQALASAEAHALTSALEEAFSATLRAPDLPPEEVREGLRDVLLTFAGEWERRIPGWIETAEPSNSASNGEGS